MISALYDIEYWYNILLLLLSCFYWNRMECDYINLFVFKEMLIKDKK